MGIQARVGASEAVDSDPSSWMDETLPLELRRELLERALRSLRNPSAAGERDGKPLTRGTDHPVSDKPDHHV
jgi:hypothetical protein